MTDVTSTIGAITIWVQATVEYLRTSGKQKIKNNYIKIKLMTLRNMK